MTGSIRRCDVREQYEYLFNASLFMIDIPMLSNQTLMDCLSVLIEGAHEMRVLLSFWLGHAACGAVYESFKMNEIGIVLLPRSK